MRRVVRLPIGFFLAVSCIGACSAAPVTELVAGVSTQVQVPKELRSIEVSVSAGGQTSYCQHFEVVQGKVQLPRTLGVNKEHDNIPVSISIIGYTDASTDLDDGRSDCPDDPTALSSFSDTNLTLHPRVVRRSIQTYREDHISFVPMPLRFSCFDNICGANSSDAATTTCKAGACVDAHVDSATLADYSDDLVYGDANTCFSSLKCLANAQPATIVDATNCLYSANGPATASGNLNVRVLFDGFVSETLDADRDEGFFIPDATKPNQFQLADGLCRPTGTAHHVISIATSGACASKTALEPPCNEGTQVLIPAPSALYLMLDRAQSMQPLLSSTQGLAQVLDLSLSDPGLATTNIGFKFLPALGAGVCAPSSYANTSLEPTDLPFEVATKAQSDIATRLLAQATGTFPPSAPPFPEVLDNAGAYAALRALDPSISYNRRAIILVTNNDVNASAGCSGSAPSATSAAAALTDPSGPIYTYVIQLQNSGDPNPTQTLQNATNLATAGGTTVFNATSAANAGPVSLNAINSVVADLASCLYETPTNITDQTAQLSIDSPLGTQSIPFNAACSSASQTSDGWNFDGTRIRICGASCATVRSVLTNTANASNASAQAAPQVVVTASQ